MAVKAMKLGPGRLDLTIEQGPAKSFAGQVTKATYSPEYKTEDPTPVLSGEEYQEPGELTGKITGDMLQDYGADSLAVWCFENAGTLAKFEFVPNLEGGLTISGQCMITPVEIGGDVRKTNSTSFEFPVVGKPKLEHKAPAESH